MSIVIFVGGATGCGKTTFANELNFNISGSKKYRRYQGFFDIAMKNGIPNEKIFEQVTSENVDDWFVDICKYSDVVISDVHYAVQLNRNRDIPSKKYCIDIYQNYVPTISTGLLEKLKEAGIKIIAIYLSCSPEVCFSRAVNRYNKKEKELRTQSLEDAKIENSAEKREWYNIISLDSIEGLELNSEVYSSAKLVEYCLKYLSKEEKHYQLKKRLSKHNF